MDRSVYLSMTGATQIMRTQTEVAHNLANAATVGFRAELSAFRSVPVQGEGLATRTHAVALGIGHDWTQGAPITTGRSLDVAVRGDGWIAVQNADGEEGYTRAGDLQVTAEGALVDARGNAVLGEGGPITVPPSTEISIGKDGTITTVPQGQGPKSVATVGRIRLVNPDLALLTKGPDGLMHTNDGSTPDRANEVTLASGVLEGSNVNATAELVKMISLSRQYDMQVKSIKTSEDDADTSQKLLQSS